jgi:hypothetical protein
MARKIFVIATILSALSAALFYGWVVKERNSVAAEAEAKRALKQLGALVIMDGNRQHVHSVDLRLAGVADKLDQAFHWLNQLPSLAIVQVSGTAVTDQQLGLIAGCRSLSMLGISQTAIGDEGLGHLTRLTNLERLFAADTCITSAGLERIAKLRRLQILELSRTKIGGDLAALADLDNLQHLLLSDVALGAEAIDTIVQMEGLRRLTITGNAVESTAITKLRAAKPNLTIDQ